MSTSLAAGAKPPADPLPKREWADDMDYEGLDETDSIPELPPRFESEVDVNGVKTITTYRSDENGKKIKTTQTVKVTKKTIRIQKCVLQRRKWEKFGECANRAAGYHGRGFTDSGITVLDGTEHVLDMTPKEKALEENNESAQRAFEKMNLGTFEAWRPKNRDAGAGVSAAKEWAEANGLTPTDDFGMGPDKPTGGGGSLAALAAGQSKSSYVPPSMRNADGSRNAELANQRDDSCTVRVSNLSEDVKDSDLRELFRRFGPIQRIYLAKDRETHASRGFAFINFFNKQDAEAAIAKLDGHGYDHLILSVGWANPSGSEKPQVAPSLSSTAFPSLGGPSSGSGAAQSRGLSAIDNKYAGDVFNPALDRFR